MVQHKAVNRHLATSLQALQELATAPAPSRELQPQGGGACAPSRPGSAGSIIAAAAAPAFGGVRRFGGKVRLQLSVSAAAGRLTYGQELDCQLAALLTAEWSPFVAAGCSASIEEELARGSLTAEDVAAAACASRGLPVALSVPQRILRPDGASAPARQAAAGGSAEASPAVYFSNGGPSEDEEQGDAWVAGVLLGIVGKRLRTALDFGEEQQERRQAQQGQAGSGGAGCSQRATLAVVRVARLSDEESRLGSAAGVGSVPAAVPTVDLHWPCTQLWRLAGPSAAVLAGSAVGGICCGAGADHHEFAAVQPAQAALPPEAVGWTLYGYCCGGSAFTAGYRSGGSRSAGLRHKPASAQLQLAEQQPQQLYEVAGGLLLRADVQAGELAVLAHLSSQPELLAALHSSSSAAEAYQQVSHCWAAAAGRLDVPGTGNAGAGQPPVLVSEAVAEAVAHALVHGWTAKKLGWVLRCSKQAAGEVLDSFLAAFPEVKAWLAKAATRGEAACSAATLGGRQRSFPALQRSDDAMVRAGHRCLSGRALRWAALPPSSAIPCVPPSAWRLAALPRVRVHHRWHIPWQVRCLQGRGKLHKAILTHMLAGSLADVATAAFVACNAALCTLAAQPGSAAAAGPGRGELAAPHGQEQAEQEQRQQQMQQQQHHQQAHQAQQTPALVLAMGGSLVVHLPPAFLVSHGDDADAATAVIATSLQQALRALQVGSACLAAPLPVAFAAGRSLHPLGLRPVRVPALCSTDAHPTAL